MEAAKNAIRSFTHKDGQKDTTVHEDVNPAVQHEHVQRTQHEQVYRPVDKEVHEEHHHTTVQPIKDREVLPEKHTHVQEGVEHKHIQHGGANVDISGKIAEERAKLGVHENKLEVDKNVQRTKAVAEAPTGEHVHHHIHEHIQPVIQKETIQPHVVHRTEPVHEVHQYAPQHHGASVAPAVSLDEFKHQHRSGLGGAAERTDAFRGEPHPVESGFVGGQGAKGTTHLTRREGEGHGVGEEAGLRQGNLSQTAGLGADGQALAAARHAHGSTGTGTGEGYSAPSTRHTTRDTETHTKPSLMDKLNPKKDADHDGKAGFMD